MDGCWWNCRLSIFRQLSQVRTCNNFQFWNSQRTCQLCIKKAPKQAKDLINMVNVTLEGLWMVADRIVDFLIFRQLSQVRTCNNFQFFNSHRTCYLSIKKGPTQAKELINMVSATLEGLWMRIVDFQFFVKLHRSGPAIIFSFWSLTEHVSYASKKHLIKQKTSSTWCMLLWKDYVWFLIKLSIFDFLSNLTGPDLQ